MTGRPSDIDKIIGHRDDGTPITVADKIVGGLRVGAYFETAIAAAGVGKETAYGWLRTAGRLRIKSRGDLTTLDLTDHEQACVRFSDAVAEADAEWELRILGDLERLGRGDIEIGHTTTETDAEGNVTKIVTRTERTLPDTRVLLWRLERRFPDRYGRRVEVTGKDGTPLLSIDDRAETILENLKANQEAKAAAKPKAVRKRVQRKGSVPRKPPRSAS